MPVYGYEQTASDPNQQGAQGGYGGSGYQTGPGYDGYSAPNGAYDYPGGYPGAGYQQQGPQPGASYPPPPSGPPPGGYAGDYQQGGYQQGGYQHGYQQGGYQNSGYQETGYQDTGYTDGAYYPQAQGPELDQALRAFASGSSGPEDFQDVFIAATVYCPRGDTPGFLALPNTQQSLIPMFTSLEELRRFAGKESKHFTLTGAEVLDMLPTGYGFVLDVEGEHRAVFDDKAVEEMVDFTMRRLYG